MGNRLNITAAAMVLTLSGCSASEVNLGNGYRLVRLDKGNAAIHGRDHIIKVYPHISFFYEEGDFVVGCRRMPEYIIENSKEFVSRFGWFILNKTNGDVKEGLSLQEVSRKMPSAVQRIGSVVCPG